MPDESQRPKTSSSPPLDPLDVFLGKANAWLVEQEKKYTEATQTIAIPDDIPRFTTEYT